MHTSTAQLIVLTCHANAFLQSGSHSDLNGNSSFVHNHEVVFLESHGKLLSDADFHPVADDPMSWLRYLKSRDVLGVRLLWEPFSYQSMSPPAGCDLFWKMEIVGNQGESEFWIGDEVISIKPKKKWFSHAQSDIERAYGQRFIRLPIQLQTVNPNSEMSDLIASKSQNLASILKEVGTLARENGLEFWAENFFDKGVRILDGEVVEDSPFNDDLVPAGLMSEEADRLMRAAHCIDVFGGMGSWNDQVFDHKEAIQQYKELNSALHQCLDESFALAASSTCKWSF